MKLKTRQILLLVTSFFLFNQSNSQLRIPLTGNADVRNALEKVISDFPKEFATLKGEVVANNPQTTEYESLLSFKSAEKNIIIQHSGSKPIYSWQALMFTTEEFESVEKKYKLLYNQLKNVNIKLNRDYDFSLTGEYDKPEETKKFSSTVFNLTPMPSGYPKLKVELSLQYELLEWKIYLLVYQREREDNEKGKTKED